MQDAAENHHYPKLVGGQLRLELSFTFNLKHVTEIIVFGRIDAFGCSWQFGAVERNVKHL